MFNFLSTLFGNKNFISKESSIFADFQNRICYWIKSSIFNPKDKKKLIIVANFHFCFNDKTF